MMKRKARELQQQRKEAMRSGGRAGYGPSGGYGSSMRGMGSDSSVIDTTPVPSEPSKPTRQPT